MAIYTRDGDAAREFGRRVQVGMDMEYSYETGAFGDPDGDGDDKFDWSLGVSTTVYGLDVGLSYVDTSEDGDGSDATAVLSLSKSL